MRQVLRVSWVLQLLIVANWVSAQSGKYLNVDTTKYIVWSEERPISWSDYKQLDTEYMDATALTAVIHSVRGGMSKGQPSFEVYVLFKKEDSWVTDTSDSTLFAHEKLHFDIAEVYGRMLRKQIAAMGKKGVDDLSEYRKAIKYLLSKFKEKSFEYDEETNHGTLISEQQRWQTFVSSELQRLHEYM
ncbi:hypothetical protein BFP97_04140 [Roseivirga sp. 4D4]|uniref:DUF922 domain-containing protein n=1 Tax=Roseivirga sp. 4D4 TaxID=1889784 RepID=UPI00085305C3|nr:hypothetical protein [Roseivirga sp. 4D4]OEK00747.1 hypothetical protein BFP97_04140 [Roseivirga sp. 4D4]